METSLSESEIRAYVATDKTFIPSLYGFGTRKLRLIDHSHFHRKGNRLGVLLYFPSGAARGAFMRGKGTLLQDLDVSLNRWTPPALTATTPAQVQARLAELAQITRHPQPSPVSVNQNAAGTTDTTTTAATAGPTNEQQPPTDVATGSAAASATGATGNTAAASQGTRMDVVNGEEEDEFSDTAGASQTSTPRGSQLAGDAMTPEPPPAGRSTPTGPRTRTAQQAATEQAKRARRETH